MADDPKMHNDDSNADGQRAEGDRTNGDGHSGDHSSDGKARAALDYVVEKVQEYAPVVGERIQEGAVIVARKARQMAPVVGDKVQHGAMVLTRKVQEAAPIVKKEAEELYDVIRQRVTEQMEKRNHKVHHDSESGETPKQSPGQTDSDAKSPGDTKESSEFNDGPIE
jgi:hypothetical protein